MIGECQCALGGGLARGIAVAYSLHRRGICRYKRHSSSTACSMLFTRRYSENDFLGNDGYAETVLSRRRKDVGCKVVFYGIPYSTKKALGQGRAFSARFGLPPLIDKEEEGVQERAQSSRVHAAPDWG